MTKPIYLYITTLFPAPETWEGGYSYDAVMALRRTGRYDVRVLRPGGGADYVYNGIPVHRIPRKAFPSGLAPFLAHRRNWRTFCRRLKELNIEADNVAVCHAHVMECALYAAKFKELNPRTLTILHHHSTSMVNLRSGRLGIVPIHATILYFYFRWLCEHVDIHVFVSRKSQTSYGKVFQTTPESAFIDVKERLLFGRFFRSIRLPRGIVFYNGYDPRMYYPLPSARGSDAMFRIGCVANFFYEKDHETLLKALACVKGRVPNVKLTCIGSGPMLEPSRALIRQLGLEALVEIRPEIDHLEMPTFYRSLDLMVVPSRIEGFCCAYVESVACGVPIMGCRGISIEEVIPESDKAKWLITPRNEVELAEKIVAFYTHRMPFAFNRTLDIDSLWREFLDSIEPLRLEIAHG